MTRVPSAYVRCSSQSSPASAATASEASHACAGQRSRQLQYFRARSPGEGAMDQRRHRGNHGSAPQMEQRGVEALRRAFESSVPLLCAPRCRPPRRALSSDTGLRQLQRVHRPSMTHPANVASPGPGLPLYFARREAERRARIMRRTRARPPAAVAVQHDASSGHALVSRVRRDRGTAVATARPCVVLPPPRARHRGPIEREGPLAQRIRGRRVGDGLAGKPRTPSQRRWRLCPSSCAAP